MRNIVAGIIMSSALTVTAAVIGCSGGGETVEYGDQVQVAYVGTLEDGTVFDSSSTGDFIEFVVGEGQVIAGFENAVVGMHVGEEKSIVLASDEAYGPRRESMMQEVPMSQFPDSIAPRVGQVLEVGQPDGSRRRITVKEIKDDSIVLLDANHPLAGETLMFDITVVGHTPKEELTTP